MHYFKNKKNNLCPSFFFASKIEEDVKERVVKDTVMKETVFK